MDRNRAASSAPRWLCSLSGSLRVAAPRGSQPRSSKALAKTYQRHVPFLVLAAAYVALAAAYHYSVPLFEAPDEPSHIQYVGFLSVENRLPLYGAQPEVPGEGMQPPLYYVFAAPLFRGLVADPRDLMRDLRDVNLSIYEGVPQRPRPGMLLQHQPLPRARQFGQSPLLSDLRPLRWVSLAFGLLAVVLTYLAGLRAFGDPPLALLCAGVLALDPQFLFTSGYVSNDTAAAAVGAGTLWLTAAALHDTSGIHRRHYVLTGLALVFAVWTKNSILPGLGVAGLAIFWMDARPFASRLRDASWALLLSLALAGPYLAWNLAKRGDLLGVGAFWEGASHMLGFEAYGGALAYFTGMYWTWTFESYWGRFGWINVRLPDILYLGYLALSVAGAAGFYWAGRMAPSSPHAFRRYLASAALVTLAAHIWFNAFAAQPQGRHLFPAAPQIAMMIAVGTAQWLGGRPDRIARGPCVAVLVCMAAVATYACFGVIVPAYR